MAAAARARCSGAREEQATVLNPGFDDFDLSSPRRQWTYLPEAERPGLPLRALTDAQRKLAHELITASVSMEGYAKVVSVMAMEHVRRALMLASAPERAHLFDPERYCFRIFGDPAARRPGALGMAARRAPRVAELHRGRRYLSHAVHVRLACPRPTARSARWRTRRRTGTVRELADRRRSARRAVIWHRPPPDFATRMVPRIGEVELPDHVSSRSRTTGSPMRSGRPWLRAVRAARHRRRRPDGRAALRARRPGGGVRRAAARRGGRGGAAPGGRRGDGEPVVRVGGRHAASGTTTGSRGRAC